MKNRDATYNIASFSLSSSHHLQRLNDNWKIKSKRPSLVVRPTVVYLVFEGQLLILELGLLRLDIHLYARHAHFPSYAHM